MGLLRMAVQAKERLERWFGLEYDPVKFWNRSAERYIEARSTIEVDPAADRWRQAVIREQPKAVIYLGVGPLSVPMADSAIVTDISRAFLDRRHDGELRVVADARKLPFRDGATDAVAFSRMLMHVPSRQHRDVIAECVRVARKSVVLLEHVRRGGKPQLNRKVWYATMLEIKGYFAECGGRVAIEKFEDPLAVLITWSAL